MDYGENEDGGNEVFSRDVSKYNSDEDLVQDQDGEDFVPNLDDDSDEDGEDEHGGLLSLSDYDLDILGVYVLYGGPCYLLKTWCFVFAY